MHQQAASDRDPNALNSQQEGLVRVRFDETAEFERAFIPAAECGQLAIERFFAEVTILNTGALRTVRHYTDAGLELRVRAQPGHVTIGYAVRAHSVTQRGQSLAPCDIILLTGDRVAELTLLGPSELVWIDIDAARLPRLDRSTLLCAAEKEDLMLRGDIPAVNALQRFAAALVLFHLNRLPLDQVQRRELQLFELIVRTLRSCDVKPVSAKREKAFSLLRRIETVMWENVEESLNLQQICKAAGCRARSLSYYFKALVGIGPMTYLKIRRLECAHRRLKESGAPARIFDIAADLGFWHMGHFSADYKRMFGTTASQTRDIARTG